MVTKIKSIASTAYRYTHLFVGAGAVAVSFLDTQALPPKFAAGVVIASQGLRVLSDWITIAHGAAPVALKVVEDAVGQVKSVDVLPPAAPLEPAGPTVTPVASGTVPGPVSASTA